MIGLKHKFLFVHMPKTAGNALQGILAKYSEDSISVSRPKHDGVERFGITSRFGTRKHTRLYEYKEALGRELYDQLFKFTIVRNPWDRVVSKYFFHMMKKDFIDRRDVAEIDEKPFDREVFVNMIEGTRTMENFLLKRPGWGKIDFLKDTDIDYFIRFESLQQGVNEVCDRIGVAREELPLRNQSKHKHYSAYYDAKTRDLVYKKLKNEIEYFGYEFESEA